MTTQSHDNDILTPFRGYLWALAHSQLNPNLKRQLDESDIVQRTLLRAHAALPGLRDRSPNVLAAWLRQILATELADAFRYCRRDKRDIARERSLAADLDQSAAGMERWCLAADQTSPSMAAERNEQMLHLANALLQLPIDQREVVISKHLRERTLQEIADESGQTVPAVAGRLRRGLAKLREVLEQSEDQKRAN
jgi:RNA polymerase sigma-70 factor, ECF subfamily